MHSHGKSDRFDGWNSYPRNMPSNSFERDSKWNGNQLFKNANRIFSNKDENHLEVMDLGLVGKDGTRSVEYSVLDSSAQLSACFSRGYSSWLFCLSQSYTWSHLQICEELLKKLFTRLKVHPDFLQILSIFGEKIGPVEESYSSFFGHYRPHQQANPFDPLGCSYQLGYNIKYVAEHGRSFPKDPFSIRETGVYHSFSSETLESSWVFIQASDDLKEQLRTSFSNASEVTPIMQFRLHAVILQTASEGWRDYLIFLEDSFSKLVDRGFYTTVKGSQLEGDLDTDFSDIRKLQILADKLKRLAHILQLNVDMVNQMKSCMRRIHKASPASGLDTVFDELDMKFDLFIYQHLTHKHRLESLIGRSQGISSLIQNILDIRTAEGNKKIVSKMHELTEQGIQENKLVKRLTFQTTQDTRSMMVIALISAIFLPATFLATLFGSNFFGFEGKRLTVASNIWIYVISAICLSGLTVMLWLWWWRRSARRGAKSANANLDLNIEKGVLAE